ncbi:MAG TPA: VOC family protein [Chloroflexota bacterium]|nr:VOC family protein [Chloroflexota bacterium]
MALRCGSPEEVDEVYRRVIEANDAGNREHPDAFWGQRYSIDEDPDGNLISQFADRLPRLGEPDHG